MRLYLFDIFGPVIISGLIFIYMYFLHQELRKIYARLYGIQCFLAFNRRRTVVDIPNFMKRYKDSCKEILRKEKNEV